LGAFKPHKIKKGDFPMLTETQAKEIDNFIKVSIAARACGNVVPSIFFAFPEGEDRPFAFPFMIHTPPELDKELYTGITWTTKGKELRDMIEHIIMIFHLISTLRIPKIKKERFLRTLREQIKLFSGGMETKPLAKLMLKTGTKKSSTIVGFVHDAVCSAETNPTEIKTTLEGIIVNLKGRDGSKGSIIQRYFLTNQALILGEKTTEFDIDVQGRMFDLLNTYPFHLEGKNEESLNAYMKSGGSH
jgi:hypothetical protein